MKTQTQSFAKTESLTTRKYIKLKIRKHRNQRKKNKGHRGDVAKRTKQWTRKRTNVNVEIKHMEEKL